MKNRNANLPPCTTASGRNPLRRHASDRQRRLRVRDIESTCQNSRDAQPLQNHAFTALQRTPDPKFHPHESTKAPILSVDQEHVQLPPGSLSKAVGMSKHKKASARISDNGLLDHTAYWLHRLSSAVLAQFEARLAETGVTVAQWKVIFVLYRGDALTSFSLANFIDVDAGSVTRVLDRLEAKQLIKRTPSVDDRRTTDLTLTDKGKKLIEQQLLPIADLLDTDWLKALSPAEVLAFKNLLAKLLGAQGIETPERWLRSGLCTDPR